MDKSLHYYMLAPVRREVLVAGKFLSGLTAAIVIFGGSAILQFPAMFWHHGELMSAYMFKGPGMSHLISYFIAAVLACVGYGSLFLAAGVLFRNPLIPAAGLLLWESINGFLPALLKKISVIYWLQSICPIPIPTPHGRQGIAALLVIDIDPAPASLAIANLLLIAAFVIVWASMRARRLEIAYGTD